MTTKPAANKFIGKIGYYWVNSLQIEVKIVDHRFVFGRDDVRISPVAGSGEQWVSLDSVTIK